MGSGSSKQAGVFPAWQKRTRTLRRVLSTLLYDISGAAAVKFCVMSEAPKKQEKAPAKPGDLQETPQLPDRVEEASEESFPASDSPSWISHEEDPQKRKPQRKSK